MSGRQHSKETKQILSDVKKGEKNPMFGKTGENHPNYGKNLPNETKIILSDAKKGEKNPMFGKTEENHPNYGKNLINEIKKKYLMLRKKVRIMVGLNQDNKELK